MQRARPDTDASRERADLVALSGVCSAGRPPPRRAGGRADMNCLGPLTRKGRLTPWGFCMFMSRSYWLGTSIVEGALELDRRYGKPHAARAGDGKEP